MAARWITFSMLILLLMGVGIASDEQYFITPLLNDPCPTDNCLTFDQFAANSTDYLGTNTTLHFLEGNHTLGSVVSIENEDGFLMQSNSSNVAIICTNIRAQMRFARMGTVHIKGFHFKGCSGNIIDTVDEFMLEDSSFIGHEDTSGTALEMIETSATLIRSTLSFNSGNKVRFVQGRSYMLPSGDTTISVNVSGAILATRSNVVIVNSMFEGNIAQVGGVIFAELQSNITMINNKFMENRATRTYLFSGFFNGGAVLYLDNGCNALIRNSSFEHNSAHSLGGVVAGGDNTTLEITDSEFANNRGPVLWLFGGVIDLSETANAWLTIVDSNFHDNSALQGGVINTAFSTAIYIAIRNSTFINNQADAFGGVLASPFTFNAVITITDSVFVSNIAHLYKAGVLDIHSSRNMTLTVTDSEFISNKAQKSGGVVHAWFIQSTSIRITNTQLMNNSVEYEDGGAILLDEAINSSLIIESCDFNKNIARRGGVMSIESATNVSTTINNTNFTENTAMEAGVIYSRDFDSASMMIITGSIFQNNSVVGDGGILKTRNSFVEIVSSDFMNNRAKMYGGTMHAIGGETVISDCRFYKNSAKFGGAVLAKEANITIIGITLTENSADIDGGVLHTRQTVTKIVGANFSNNSADNNGGVMYTHGGETTIINTAFNQNSAGNDGGIIRSYLSNLRIYESHFITNWAENYGGVFYIDQSNLTIDESAFMKNRASAGGVLQAEQGTLMINQSSLSNNTANTGGVMWINQATVNIRLTNMTANRGIISAVFLLETTNLWSNVLFSNNEGTILAFGSSVTIVDSALTHNKQPTQWTYIHKLLEGGAITTFQSDVILNGTCNLNNNEAEDGGAIKALESKVQVYGNMIVENNRASKTGGGIYLYFSELTSWKNSVLNLIGNSAASKGGGIHATGSSIKVKESGIKERSTLHFVENTAEKGGGLYIKKSSKLYVMKSQPEMATHSKSITFTANSAEFGGAIYASDDGMCSLSMNSTEDECFFQTLAMYNVMATNPYLYQMQHRNILFFNNTAEVSGHSLFGGSLDKCKVNPFSELTDTDSHQNADTLTEKGYEYIKKISNIQDSDISSYPVRVCFCKDGNPDCTYQPDPIHITKGKEKKLVLSVAVVDQINRPIKGAALYSHLGSGNDVCQNHIQSTDGNCSQVSFAVFSNNDTEDLILSLGKGPCKQSEESKARVMLEFSCLQCPIGFELATANGGCQCVCDSQLFPFFTNCSGDVLIRERNVWIANIATPSAGNASISGNQYLIHPFCPLNYCHPPTSRVQLNLNVRSGIDAQCVDNRSGLLCGTCQSGHSLSLGSSHCLTCSTHWLAILIVILIAAFLAGMLLVVVLLVLNLTVAVGTLNGIIFYTNIVAANASIYLPFSYPNFITVFISWLNLEIGFDTCFFEGMDAYWKTLIQLIFPVYIIILVVVVIIISETFSRFAKLIGKRNPVATLATLILLCYAKLLHTVIASLSFTVLRYPDGSQQTVWLPDATVAYLKGKHIVLFVIAVLILIVGIVYTALLLSWQWLLRLQNIKVFKWMSYQKLCHFIEPYHAPYAFKYRYWTGLLLLIRVVLYMVSAINVEGDPRVTLVANLFVIGSLLLMKGVFEKWIYKKWPIDILETIMYFNILAFSAFTWYTLDSGKSQAAVAYTSVMTTFFLLLSVITFHVFKYTAFGSFLRNNQIFKWTSAKVQVKKQNDLQDGIPQVNKIKHKEEELNRPTYSVVELYKPRIIRSSKDEEDVTY